MVNTQAPPTYASLRSAPRVNLSKAVPLAAPFTVFIEPTNVCNFRCVMCPESFPDYQQLAGYYQRMSMDMYRKVLGDLKEFGPIKAVKFYHEGEPLLHPELATMIRMVLSEGITARTELTTNASLLDEKRAMELVEAGLNYVRISIYSTDATNHRDITQNSIEPARIRANLVRLRQIRDALGSKTPVIYAQYLHESPAGEAAFRSAYTGVADELGVDYRHNWNGADERREQLVSIGYAPDENGKQRAFQYTKQACPEPFYVLAIKANGDVTPCCIDWSGNLKIGSVRESSLREIWNGDRLRRIQQLHLAKKRHEIGACRNCTLIYNFPDNIDDLDAETFMRRVNR